MPIIARKSIIHLTAPIALGDKSVIEGYISEQDGAGVRVYDQPELRGRSQFFPRHLVEKIEDAL